MTENTTNDAIQAIAAVDAEPARPQEELTQVEILLRRLEEQSAVQTVMAKKRLFWARFSAGLLGVTAAAVLLTVGRTWQMVPQAELALDRANTALSGITAVTEQLRSADIPALLENADQTLNETRESLSEVSDAVQDLTSIDIAGLNRAIQDLQKLAKNPLSALFSRN